MLKLFGSKQVQPDLHTPELEKRYTRFPHAHNRVPAQHAEEPGLRPCETAPVPPRRRSAHKPAQEPPEASLADQLYSESSISTALLRRALPQRFADMDDETRERAKEGLADLHAQFR